MIRNNPRDRALYLAWLAFCVLIAFWLRTYRLDLQSLWYDEGVTVDIARRTFLDLTRWTAQDIQPPLYYYVVSAWGKVMQAIGPQPDAINMAIFKLWGGAWSEWSVRYVSVIFGTLTVPMMAALSVQLTRRRTAGAIAGLLSAVHPWLFYYSQEARMYAMLTFLGIFAGYVLFSGQIEEQRRETSGIDGEEETRKKLSKSNAGDELTDTGRVTVQPPAGRVVERIETKEEGEWLPERTDTGAPKWWLFIGIATAAVYTHYFAFFLLAALGLGYLLRSTVPTAPNLIKSGPVFQGPKRFASLVSAFVTILVLYIPWFFAFVSQLRGDSSYWQGEFKLSEAIRKVAISFVGGETVTEQLGLWLLIPIGLLTIISIVALIWPTRQTISQQPLVIALLWWLLPTTLILLLALLIPKFNPRYVMLALPGLILLWSAGLARMIDGGMSGYFLFGTLESKRADIPTATPKSTRNPRRTPLLALGTLLILITLAIFCYADRNYFTDPEFTKTQWKPLANYVEKRIPPDDVVVLTSGHTWPIWNYYAPHVPAVSIPRMRILDVNNVLDYPTAASLLGNALSDKQGAWLVSWQDEVVDPLDVVPILLERAGSEVPSERDYWDISLRRFEKLEPVYFQPDIGTPLSINYGNQLILRGYDTHDTGELLLYWQRHPDYQKPITGLDLRLAGQLRTPEDLAYASFTDVSLTVEEWPTEQWRPEQLIISKISASIWAGYGAIPGSYGIQLGLYDPGGDLSGYDILNDTGEPMGKQRLLPIYLPAFTSGAPTQFDQMATQLGPGLYATVALGPEPISPPENAQPEIVAVEVEAGRSLPLRIEWLATDEVATPATQEATQEASQETSLQVRWQNQSGETVATTKVPIASGIPLSAWPTNQKLRTIHRLPTESTLSPDRYDLWATIVNKEVANSELETDARADAAIEAQIASVRLLPSTLSFTVPSLAQSVNAEFGGQIALRGLLETTPLSDVLIDTSNARELNLTFVWQALEVPQADYAVTAQLLNEQGIPVSQVDLQLPGKSSTWTSEQVEEQTVTLSVPVGFSGGQVIAAVYDAAAEGFPRLRRSDGTDFVIVLQ